MSEFGPHFYFANSSSYLQFSPSQGASNYEMRKNATLNKGTLYLKLNHYYFYLSVYIFKIRCSRSNSFSYMLLQALLPFSLLLYQSHCVIDTARFFLKNLYYLTPITIILQESDYYKLHLIQGNGCLRKSNNTQDHATTHNFRSS
jgi:hypothetical protein